MDSRHTLGTAGVCLEQGSCGTQPGALAHLAGKVYLGDGS